MIVKPPSFDEKADLCRVFLRITIEQRIKQFIFIWHLQHYFRVRCFGNYDD